MYTGNVRDMNGNEIRNMVFQTLATAPSNFLVGGRPYYNSADTHLYVYNGSAFQRLDNLTDAEFLAKMVALGGTGSATDADKLDGQHGAYYQARANHTGTQLAATISDFDTQVRTSRLDQMAAPTASVALNSQKITGLANGTAAGDAINFGQAQALINGLDNKASVRVAATVNVNTASPGTTIDGTTMVAGDRALLPMQTTGSQNGIWIWNGSAVAMTRATDADIDAEVTAGLYVFVSEGTTNGNRGFQLFTDDPITVGTTALNFQVVSGAGQLNAGAGLTKTGDTIDIVGAAGRIVVNSDNIDLATGVATAGTFRSVTVNTYGQVTAGTNPTTRAGYGLTDANGKYTALIGNASATSFAINQATHQLASDASMTAQVYFATSGDLIDTDVNINPSNGTVTITFSTAPTTNQFRVVITG